MWPTDADSLIAYQRQLATAVPVLIMIKHGLQ